MSDASRTQAVTASGLLDAARALVSPLRPAERILVVTWMAGLTLVVASNSGELNLWQVFEQYLIFFARYLIVLLFASRLLFWIDERWHPRATPLRRLKLWVWGNAPEGSVAHRADRLAIGNHRELAARRRPSALATDLEMIRGALLLFANLSIYSQIKVRIALINDTVGDAAFERLDHLLFGEGLIRAIEGWFAGNPGVADYFARIYLHDYIWMVLLVFLLYVRRDLFSLRWTFLAVCLTYILGILITVAYPSLGPCFMDPDRFQWLRDTHIGRAQNGLAMYYQHVIEVVHAGRPFRAQAFAGIAAFPSLHVAHMVIMLLVALRTVPLYAAWMAWVTVATSIATVGFGWHYAVDALGGIALAVIVTEGLYRLLRRWGGAPSAGEPAP